MSWHDMTFYAQFTASCPITCIFCGWVWKWIRISSTQRNFSGDTSMKSLKNRMYDYRAKGLTMCSEGRSNAGAHSNPCFSTS